MRNNNEVMDDLLKHWTAMVIKSKKSWSQMIMTMLYRVSVVSLMTKAELHTTEVKYR